MKAENILKTDHLDILFEHKNKEYGAYMLRKFYNQRLKKSLAITSLLVLVFALLQSYKKPKKYVEVYVGNTISLQSFEDNKTKKVEPEKPKAKSKEKVLVKQFTTPQIVPKNQVKIPVINVDSLDNVKIGLANIDGKKIGVIVPPITSGGEKGTDTTISTNTSEPVEPTIYDHPSVMPEFIGGLEALHKYMLRNLRQPDDIEEGGKIVVYVKFVVEKNGSIGNVEITNSGREDLDAEVIRVVKNMPHWKAGMQNNDPVAVYFTMPVSFINSQ